MSGENDRRARFLLVFLLVMHIIALYSTIVLYCVTYKTAAVRMCDIAHLYTYAYVYAYAYVSTGSVFKFMGMVGYVCQRFSLLP